MLSVAVIVPAYNASRFIRECLDSALAQTAGTPDQIIVVDDGSTDDTVRVAGSYGSPVRVIRQSNAGAAGARNAGAATAKTEWLAFLDADDVWLPSKLESQLERAGETGQFVYSDRTNVGILDGLPAVQSDIQPMFDGDVFLRLLSENVITTSTVLLKTTLFRDVGGFSDDSRLPPAEDWDLWLRCAERVPILLVREPLVKYRLHAAGASRNVERMNRARQLVVERGLKLSRGRALTRGQVRTIQAALWSTNGWDAARHGLRKQAVRAYARSIAFRPFSPTPYLGLMRVAFTR